MPKVFVVTGVSRGIGAATARLAAARGYAVCIGYHHNEAAASAVVRDILEAGGQATAIAADVREEADVIRLFEGTDAALGTVTALYTTGAFLDVAGGR